MSSAWLIGVVVVALVTTKTTTVTSLTNDAWHKPGCHLIGHSKIETIPGCPPFHSLTNACRGFCLSKTQPSASGVPQPVTSLGRCCSIIDTETVTLKLHCVDGMRNITYELATSCSCFHCRKS